MRLCWSVLVNLRLRSRHACASLVKVIWRARTCSGSSRKYQWSSIRDELVWKRDVPMARCSAVELHRALGWTADDHAKGRFIAGLPDDRYRAAIGMASVVFRSMAHRLKISYSTLKLACCTSLEEFPRV